MTTQAMNLNIRTEAPSLTEAQWNRYYGDLHAFLEEHFLSDRFTMFLVTQVVDSKFSNRGEEYFYVGLEKQRELLEGNMYSIEHLNGPWNFLKKEFGRIANEIRVTRDVEKAEEPTPNTDSMNDYFNTREFRLTPEHIAEKAILDHHFNLDEYHYFSISVKWEGRFHTAVHIILSEKDLRNNFLNKKGDLNHQNYKNLSRFCEAMLYKKQIKV